MGQTIEIKNSTLEIKGDKLSYSPTGAFDIVDANTEVNFPPVWEGHESITPANVEYILKADVDGNIFYRPDMGSDLFNSNGLLTVNNVNIGDELALYKRVFVSASDPNTNDSITLSLISETIVSGGNGVHDTQEIGINDINVIFPDNGNSTDFNTASFYIVTSSNFETFEDIEYQIKIKAVDESNDVTIVNNPSYSSEFHNQPFDLQYDIKILNIREAPFFITESGGVPIESNTTPLDNVSEITINLGNEDEPDFSLIPTIYIKDRDRATQLDQLDAYRIKLFGDAFNSNIYSITTKQAQWDAGNPMYLIRTGSSVPDSLILSSSNLENNQTDKTQRYFQFDLNPDLLPQVLSAAGSPYKFELSASDGSSTANGIYANSSSCLLTLTVDNLNPVWIQNDGGIFITSQREIGYRLSTQHYASASDPGGDNVELTFTLTPDTLGSTLVGDDFEFFSVNDNTPTASFYLRTSSQFPSYPSNPMSANALTELIVTATDDVTLAANNQSPGTANRTVRVSIDAPPAFNTNTLNITKTEDEAGLISNSDETYPNAADPYEGFIGGTCNLDTGSGFTITSDDSRVQDNWFAFTGNDATAGNLATFNIVTSSLFQRVDADVTASLVVTATDARNQEATCNVEIRITNEDALEDIFPSSSNLQFLIAPDIDGETTLGNTVNFSSTIQAVPAIGGGFEGQILSIVGSKKLVFANSTFADITDTFTTANGTSGLSIKAVTTDGIADNSPRYDSNTMSTGPGTIIWWWKITDGISSGITKRIFGNDNSFELRISSTNTITVDMPSNDGNISNYAGSDGGDFHMLTLTFNGTSGDTNTAKLYLNKTLKTTTGGFGNSTVNTKITEAGSIGGRLDLINGGTNTVHLHPVTMSMMAYYDAELNQEDITQIFNAFSASHGLS